MTSHRVAYSHRNASRAIDSRLVADPLRSLDQRFTVKGFARPDKPGKARPGKTAFAASGTIPARVALQRCPVLGLITEYRLLERENDRKNIRPLEESGFGEGG